MSTRYISSARTRSLLLPHHHHPARLFSRSSPRYDPTAGETIESMVEKLKASLSHAAGQSEGYQASEEGLRMLVFGKPGSGKGTLSARLVQQYDISFVSTGDVLRKEIAAKSEVGRKAEEVVASGGLVSDELMLEIVKTELDRLRGKSWIVDGFPRTLHQGELLDSVLLAEGRPLNMIVHLNVPDSVIMARIAARWVHLPSGRVYNSTYSAPKTPGKDDVTGEPLSKRPDDTPETFSKRLQAYYESTAPLLEYFAKAYPESLISLSGSTSDEVSPLLAFTPQITVPDDLRALDQLWPQLQALVEPYGLRRRPAALDETGAAKVRQEADDLRDPDEEVRHVAEKVKS
ncbi:adenylate kinase-domain-containing protein [Naematelia encephala]|uniref:Adenylate kinase-domain-containing protein n=1 Tax=Naematelia encephala TaxID=71784 RepID=A0A1Y2AXB2_9TREE|nr:adenylate kinase-domain-containing protein [Naematelia encephala]